jgi:hypothetical protein
MTAPAYCVLDGDGGSNLPKLPAADCEELGGLFFVDSTKAPPRTHEHVSMKDVMQWEMLIQRLCQTAPLVTIWAHNNGVTAPTIDAVRSMVAGVTALNITPARGGVGSYTFTLPSGTLPTRPGHPKCWSNTDQIDATATQSGNVVTVTVTENAGDPSDTCAFIIDIFGGA